MTHQLCSQSKILPDIGFTKNEQGHMQYGSVFTIDDYGTLTISNLKVRNIDLQKLRAIAYLLGWELPEHPR